MPHNRSQAGTRLSEAAAAATTTTARDQLYTLLLLPLNNYYTATLVLLLLLARSLQLCVTLQVLCYTLLRGKEQQQPTVLLRESNYVSSSVTGRHVCCPLHHEICISVNKCMQFRLS